MTDTRPTDDQLAPTASGQVLHAVVDGTGWARLNRPRALNALSRELIDDLRALLASWADDDAVARISLDGAGEKGFCAGGDVRHCRDLILAGDADGAVAFWEAEYGLIADVLHHPKPVTAYQHGIVMGGGLGLSAAAGERVVDPGATLAMPETQIGFAPDAGSMFFLSRAGNLGRHLALAGASMNAADALAVGFSDRCDGASPAPVGAEQPWLACYEQPDPAAVVAALEADGSDGAREASATIRAKSPLMVHVAWRALSRSATLDVDTVLANDLVMARATMSSPDFVEGVRAQLVDKDRQPRWQHARLEDVTDAEVARFLA